MFSATLKNTNWYSIDFIIACNEISVFCVWDESFFQTIKSYGCKDFGHSSKFDLLSHELDSQFGYYLIQY